MTPAPKPLTHDMGLFLQHRCQQVANDADRLADWFEKLEDGQEASASLRKASVVMEQVRDWAAAHTPEFEERQ